ncbi:MAG: SH3 domain-containing protein [Anaerolineae bacterium]|nr:SH3 domain-containing protein [Anaerolineae bacterium]
MMSRKLVWLLLAMLGVMSLAASPAAAQAGITWTSEFYNNTILNGRAVVTRQDTAIAFDWGSGSPASGINADNFSARFGTDPFFAAGTYRFWALADDKVKIWVDFARTPLIDTFNNPSVARIVSADIQLSQGVHHIQVDFAEETGNAYLYVTWANLATNPQGPNFPPLNNSNPFPSSGPWTAQYFSNPSLFGSPTLIQSEASPSHDWGAGSPVASIPADNFSARWTSVQTLPFGTYQLSVRADDGVRVAIDNIYYINEFHSATGQTYTTNVTLAAGQHTFLVEYYEATGLASLSYSFTLVGAGGGFATPTPMVTGAYATVTGAYRLNVRGTPDPITGVILTKISRNETYSIVGRNSNTSWWQINVNGIVGWVNARYVTAYNTAGVPITSGGVVVPTPTPQPINCSSAPAPRLIIGRYGRVTPGLPNNVRSQPSSTSQLTGQIPPGYVFQVLGGPVCSSGFYWWQINYNGLIGWTPEGGSGQYWVEPV